MNIYIWVVLINWIFRTTHTFYSIKKSWQLAINIVAKTFYFKYLVLA